MSRPNILMLLDIDGVLVKSFKDDHYSQTEYAKMIQNQPINAGIFYHIKKWYEQTEANITIQIVTKRKASLLQTITDIQLADISFYISGYDYYPEELDYGLNHAWKNDVFYEKIKTDHWDKIIIVEDDINQLTALTFYVKGMEYWLALENKYLVKATSIEAFEESK